MEDSLSESSEIIYVIFAKWVCAFGHTSTCHNEQISQLMIGISAYLGIIMISQLI